VHNSWCHNPIVDLNNWYHSSYVAQQLVLEHNNSSYIIDVQTLNLSEHLV